MSSTGNTREIVVDRKIDVKTREAHAEVSKEESREFYNNWVDYLSETNPRHLKVFEGLKWCRIGPGVKVLDLGCGTGQTSEYLGKSGCEVLAIDFAEKLIEYAKEHRAHDNVTYEVADITTLMMDQQFDLIVCVDVIEHLSVESLTGFLRTIYEHSHEDTMVYVNVPYAPWQEFAHRFAIGDTQPIDNVIPLAGILGLFESIQFYPVLIDIYGLGSPVEYVELVFVKSDYLYHRWAHQYSELGVIDAKDIEHGGHVPAAKAQENK